MVVVIVVDWQQVPVHIGVTHKQVDVRDPMHMLQQAIELIKASRLGPVQREPPEFCSKLTTLKRHQYVYTNDIVKQQSTTTNISQSFHCETSKTSEI